MGKSGLFRANLIKMAQVIVTATRQSKKLQDVAMTVNVATREQLSKFKIFDVKDMQKLAPGLDLTNTTLGEGTINEKGASGK